MPTRYYVTKADGRKERFRPLKLEKSLKRSGATASLAKDITEHIISELAPEQTTAEIYNKAFKLLDKKHEQPVAARYSLRRSILELGPSGYPFEEYVAKIFEALGYVAHTQQVIEGKCSPHEVDVVAYNDEIHLGAELKFHNSYGTKTDLKVALYVHARFEDIKQSNTTGSRLDEGWLITNTKFTKTAIRFSKCAHLKLLGWNYPSHRSLQKLVEETKVYPITCLPSLSRKEKSQLLDKNLVLCKDLEYETAALTAAGIKKARIATIVNESQALCALPQ